jgi:hypothetical protein
MEKFAARTAPGDCPHYTEHTTRLIWYNEATARVVCANVPYFLDALRIYIYIKTKPRIKIPVHEKGKLKEK